MSQTLTVSPVQAAQETAKVAPSQQVSQSNQALLEPALNKPVEVDQRLAQLSRKEKAFRAQVRDFQQKQREWQDKLINQSTQPQSQQSPQDFKKLFLEDPTKVGLTYEEIANRYLHQPSPEMQKTNALEAKIMELEARLTAQAEEGKKGQTEAYTQAIKQINSEVNNLVKSQAQEYEAIAANHAQRRVVDLIELTYKEDGLLMSVEEACKEVEDYLIDRALAVSKLSKVQAKLKPATQEDASKTEEMKTPLQSKTQINTLTRSAVQNLSKPMTNAERRQRAIAAFKGELK